MSHEQECVERVIVAGINTASGGPAQADIDALTAVANRTAIQNVELRALRRDIGLQRTCRTLARNAVVTARFALFLDGERARPSDLDGDGEG